MGNCCVAGAASSDKATSSFKWSIDNFSSLVDMVEECTYSRVFRMLGHDWFLNLNPLDWNRCDKECVSLRLELSAAHSMEPGTMVDAYFILTMSIYDGQSGVKHIERHVRHFFHNADMRSRKECMIRHKLAALNNNNNNSSRGLFRAINNKGVVFGVKFIEVFTQKAKPTTSETPLFVKNKNRSTFPAEAQAYTWCIADLFGMKNPCYSPEFTVGFYKWSIRLDREENHISLYLKKMTDDLPGDDYAVLVEFTVSVKNQPDGTSKHLKTKTGRFLFSNRARVWGWENLVSMEDMHDSSDGYLIKTMCCIEAEVRIVGSSRVR